MATRCFRQPAVRQPAIRQPAVRQPAVRQPAVRQPAVRQPAVRQPAVRQPAVRQPAVRQPAMSQPAVRQLASSNHSIFPTCPPFYLDEMVSYVDVFRAESGWIVGTAKSNSSFVITVTEEFLLKSIL
ncbi:hypothetical protein Tco_0273722 [Tanacetum coccineum]